LEHRTEPSCRTGGDRGRAALERLTSAGSDPHTYLAGRKDRAGGKGARPVVGCVCSYVPEEVILAAGLHPVRLGAAPGAPGPAESSLQSFACSFARACLDGLLTHRCGELAAVVFAHTCDSLRAAAELWRIHTPREWLFHFYNLPARVDGPGALRFTAAEVARLAAALGAVEGARPVTPETLAGACRLVNGLRESLRRLGAVRVRRPDILPGSTFIAIARGASVLDREEAAAALETLARDLEEQAGAAGQDPHRPRLLVTGGFLETEAPLLLIEEAGADVVADDLCLGGRCLSFPGVSGPPGGTAADPFTALARAYLSRVPCPAKHPPSRRFEFVLNQAEQSAADGVVFLLQKFCDPHAFDYPALRDRLEAAGTPSLHLEVEQGALSRGQAFTRLEAFVEHLRARRVAAHPRRRATPGPSSAGRAGGGCR